MGAMFEGPLVKCRCNSNRGGGGGHDSGGEEGSTQKGIGIQSSEGVAEPLCALSSDAVLLHKGVVEARWYCGTDQHHHSCIRSRKKITSFGYE